MGSTNKQDFIYGIGPYHFYNAVTCEDLTNITNCELYHPTIDNQCIRCKLGYTPRGTASNGTDCVKLDQCYDTSKFNSGFYFKKTDLQTMGTTLRTFMSCYECKSSGHELYLKLSNLNFDNFVPNLRNFTIDTTEDVETL